MLYKEIISVGSDVLSKHANALCGQDLYFLNIVIPLCIDSIYSLYYIYIYISFNITI